MNAVEANPFEIIDSHTFLVPYTPISNVQFGISVTESWTALKKRETGPLTSSSVGSKSTQKNSIDPFGSPQSSSPLDRLDTLS